MKILRENQSIELGSFLGNVYGNWHNLSTTPMKRYYLYFPPMDYCNVRMKVLTGLDASRFGLLTPDYESCFEYDGTFYNSLEGVSALYWKLKDVIDGGVKLDIVKINDDYERRVLGIENSINRRHSVVG